MIRYTLNCDQSHQFESWFHSAAAFDRLLAAGMVACAECGSAKVEKGLMAPAVRPGRKAAAKADARPLSSPPATPAELALMAMRKEIEKNSEYVGMNFAKEARKIHVGDAPERAIYGEARPEDARSLIEDGVQVSALPFMPSRKTN
jgi:hypothetical protein